MNRRLGSIAIAAIVTAAAGLLAGPSEGSPTPRSCPPPLNCTVSLTSSGPSPSSLTMLAAGYVEFDNTDSVAHTVVFANGRCSLILNPGQAGGPGVDVYGVPHPNCNDNFTFEAGTYAYTVDGTFAGTVITKPLRRVVTLTARRHDVRGGARLKLHGQVSWSCRCALPQKKHYFGVTVLARESGKHTYKPIATVPQRFLGTFPGRWKLTVRPTVTTTYIAEVTGQLPQGQIWANAKSRPFAVRARR